MMKPANTILSIVAIATLIFAACDQANPVVPAAGESGEANHSESGAESGSAGGEPGESGTQYALSDTARETRSGVDLTMHFDAGLQAFVGTVVNNSNQTAPLVRVEIHLSNGVELGPTQPADLAAGASRTVQLSAAGQQFSAWDVHIEVGPGT